jgi:hypothetical protein
MIGRINLDRERSQFRVVGEKPSTKWKHISPSLPHDFNYHTSAEKGPQSRRIYQIRN